METRPLGRCCDCRWLGVTSLGVLCEASLPDWAAQVIRENVGPDAGELLAVDVLKLRRCDCYEAKEKADA